MVEEILSPLRKGRTVCAAFYGHPAVFVYPGQRGGHARPRRGLRAWMLPGISSLDCLWCDLGIDPAASGCQIYPATEFVLQRRLPDTAATVVLLQINVIGVDDDPQQPDWSRLPVLVDYLRGVLSGRSRGDRLRGIAVIRSSRPMIERAALGELAGASLRPGMTLVVPPVEAPADRAMARRLGIEAGA